MNTNECKYVAFISYRHLPRDSKVAEKVQRTIEGYKLPKHVKHDDATDHESASSRRLGKCFRDKDELSATHSLPQTIQQALRQSRYLIVICSPETCESDWVKREIEAFLATHDRSSIICVLADGDSKSSIPEVLRFEDAPNSADGSAQFPIEPLAADLRPGSECSSKDELLRIIATIAGCDYDDLKRRQRARKRNRTIVIAAIALILAASLAFLAHLAFNASRNQLIAESSDLAARSQEQLAEGDRMGAIQTALAALPSSEDPDRPFAEDAQLALENAVEVAPDSSNVWRPAYWLQVPGNIVTFASSEEGCWAAVLDDTLLVTLFDLRTGAKLFDLDLKEHTIATEVSNTVDNPLKEQWKLLSAGSDHLIIGNRTGEGNLICVDIPNKGISWEHERINNSSICISDDGTLVFSMNLFDDDTLLAALFDVESGDSVDWGEYDGDSMYASPTFMPSEIDPDNKKVHVGYAGYLLEIDFEKGTLDIIRVNDHMVRSVVSDGERVFAATSWKGDETGKNFPYSFDCIKGGKQVWEESGTFDYSLIGERNESVAVEGVPRIAALCKEDGNAVAFTAGSHIDILRPNNGKTVYAKDFGSSVVGVGRGWLDDDHDSFYVATADGVLDIWMPSYETANSQSMQTILPIGLDSAEIKWYGGTDLLALAKNAEDSDKLLVYRSDLRDPEETIDFTLEQLIDEAQEILALNAGSEGNAQIVNSPEEGI